MSRRAFEWAVAVIFIFIMLIAVARAQDGPALQCDPADLELEKYEALPDHLRPKVVYEAEWFSKHIFGFAVPVNMMAIFPQRNGSTIIIPCRAHRTWEYKETVLITVDKNFYITLTKLKGVKLKQEKKGKQND